MTTADSPTTGGLPERLGRYRILKELGQGGMGVVYLAHDPELNRLAALKIPLGSGGAEAAARFLHCARAAAALQHPSICPLHEVGVLDGVPYLVMAYIDGCSLAERMRVGRPPAAEAAALVHAVALALADAHDSGVVHGDVKPSNILLNRRGEPILTDFGADAVGTPAYMAPERLRGEGAGHERAGDLYALGVVLYELLSGRLPFDGDAQPPSAHTPGLDSRLDAICLKAMAREPADRYADMAAFADALAPFGEAARAGRPDESWSLPISHEGNSSPLTEAEKSKLPHRPSRWPWRLVMGTAAGSALAVAVSYALTQYEYLQQRDAAPPADERAALLARSRDEYRQGLDERAFADFAEVLRSVDAGTPLARSKDYADRAWVCLQMDRRDEALADCAAALRLDANCTAAYLLSAQVWHDKGRRDEELDAYADALKAVKPVAAADYADLARAALALGRPDDAVRACDEAARLDPKLADAFEVRALARRRLGEKDRAAADDATAARLMNPQSARDFLDRSRLHALAGETDLALADADRALEMAPRLSAALRQRGSVYRGKNDRERAVADYREAVTALTQRFAADYFDRGWLYNELGDFDRAAADLERALALGLESGEVRRELGHAYRNRKDYAGARPHLDAAVRLLPDDALSFGERAALALAEGRHADAAEDYGGALALGADDAATYAGRGDAYFQSQEYEKAVADYTRTLARTPATDRVALADLYDRRGVAYARLARPAEAVADYDRAIENDPDDPVLYRNRAASRLRAGDAAAAEADVRKADELEAMRPIASFARCLPPSV